MGGLAKGKGRMVPVEMPMGSDEPNEPVPSEAKWLHADVTRRIIGAAQRVHRTLGAGFLEKVYENALVIELEEAGLQVVQGAPIEVRYRDRLVGVFRADLLVDDLVILEIKAVDHLILAHEVQLVNYLRATPVEVGLLINFGVKLEIKRRAFSNYRKASLPH
jgi:GxxExxY protein